MKKSDTKVKKDRKDKTIKKESNNKSILPLIMIVVLFVVILIVTYYFSSNTFKNENSNNKDNQSSISENNVEENHNKDVVKDKNVNGILFSNINCSYDGYRSLITYTITNNTSERISLNQYDVELKDKDGNVIVIISPTLNDEIAPGESVQTGNAVNMDLSSAYSMNIVVE